MLRWILKRLRAFTQKSTPSSEVAEQTLLELSASSFAEIVKEKLQILGHVVPVKGHCETPASAASIIRDEALLKEEARKELRKVLDAVDLVSLIEHRPMKDFVVTLNMYGTYYIQLRLESDIMLTIYKGRDYDGTRVSVQVHDAAPSSKYSAAHEVRDIAYRMDNLFCRLVDAIIQCSVHNAR